MKLVHKGLIFLTSVLALQTLLFAGLTSLLASAEREKLTADQSRTVVSILMDTEHRLHRTSVTLCFLAISRNKSELKRTFDELCASIPAQVKALEQSPTLTKEQLANVINIEKGTNYLIAIMRDFKSTIESDPSGLKLLRLQRTLDYEILPQLNELSIAIQKLANEQRTVQQPLFERAQKLSKGFLLGMFLANILTTVILVIGFTRGIASRVGIIAQNIRRFASNKTLHRRLPGTDEIALVDHNFHDMTQALSEAVAKDKAVFNNLPIGLITCGAGGTIESLNPTAEQLLGTNVEELASRSFVDLLQGNIPTFEELLQECKDRSIQHSVSRHGDEPFPAEIALARFQHKGQDRFVICVADITEREYAEKLRREVVSVVSHDLKTPLSSIACFLDLLKQGCFAPIESSLTAAAAKASRECDRLIRLTADLLDAAALEAGSVKLTKQHCQVTTLFERALDSVCQFANEHGIELAVADPERLEASMSVYADEDRLVQLLVNFLVNAIKFSPRGECVTLGALQVKNGIKLMVCDKGRGVPAELRNEIFQRFKQVRAQDAKIGTGLGLAICKLLAESHGGEVGVESEVGQGSTFWVFLPDPSPASVSGLANDLENDALISG